MTRVIWLYLALLAAVAVVLAYADEIDGCTTDHECAAFCPAEDQDCDGGPQPSRYPSIIGVRG